MPAGSGPNGRVLLQILFQGEIQQEPALDKTCLGCRRSHPADSSDPEQLSKPIPPTQLKPPLREAKDWISVSEVISHTKL